MSLSSPIERQLWEIEQRRLIELTLLDYAAFVDRNDPEALVAQVFSEDGRFELGSQRAVIGRENLRLMFAKTLASFSRTSHHVSNIRIDLEDDSHAQASAYVYAWHVAVEDGRRIDLWGRYADRLALTNAGWRITVRRLTVAGTDAWVDAPFELSERNPNPCRTPAPRVSRQP